MTRIDFHTPVGTDTPWLDYACRLVRKIYNAGESLYIIASDTLLHAFDAQLWTFSALDFIPHCRLDNTLTTVTPIILATHCNEGPTHQILLNLSTDMPLNFARFTRLLEVVGNDEMQLSAARTRYRFYRDRGYPVHTYRYSS